MQNLGHSSKVIFSMCTMCEEHAYYGPVAIRNCLNMAHVSGDMKNNAYLSRFISSILV